MRDGMPNIHSTHGDLAEALAGESTGKRPTGGLDATVIINADDWGQDVILAARFRP